MAWLERGLCWAGAADAGTVHEILTACLKPLRAGLAQWLQEGRVSDAGRELPFSGRACQIQIWKLCVCGDILHWHQSIEVSSSSRLSPVAHVVLCRGRVDLQPFLTRY